MTADKTARKQRGRPFPKGKSGNPSGKPKGSRNKITLAIEALFEGEAEALTRKAIEKALEGDMVALRLCLERIAPAKKDAPVTFALPTMETAADATKAAGAILAAVAAGNLTPSEGTAIAGLVETYRRTLETQEIEARIAAHGLLAAHHRPESSGRRQRRGRDKTNINKKRLTIP